MGVPEMATVDSDKKWQIEQDAKTLVEGELIRKDSNRFKAAVAHIKKENSARATAVKP